MLEAMLSAVQDVPGSLDPETARNYLGLLGAGIAVGLTVLGTGLGIGRIGDAMSQGIARQPEAADHIRISAIILAALIEGVAFFGLVIALLFRG